MIQIEFWPMLKSMEENPMVLVAVAVVEAAKLISLL